MSIKCCKWCNQNFDKQKQFYVNPVDWLEFAQVSEEVKNTECAKCYRLSPIKCNCIHCGKETINYYKEKTCSDECGNIYHPIFLKKLPLNTYKNWRCKITYHITSSGECECKNPITKTVFHNTKIDKFKEEIFCVSKLTYPHLTTNTKLISLIPYTHKHCRCNICHTYIHDKPIKYVFFTTDT
jgi:hypothetical protein